MGQWDTWLSATLRGKDGRSIPGVAAYEPTRYRLEVTLGDKAQRLEGTARIDLEPVLANPPRLVTLALHADLTVRRVTDAAGAELFTHRNGAALTVVLPRPPAAGETVSLAVEYQGNVISKDGRTFALLDTFNWYPHAGRVDRAPYDVTFRWPRSLDLLASGRRVEGGDGPDGTRWERRTLDRPTDGFTFEVGKFKTETLSAGAAGHVKVTLAFDAEGRSLHEKAVREEIGKTVVDALGYFEEQFGPYPLDEMTVVTVPRDFSQALLGFVTLSNFMMADFGVWNQFLGFEDRRTVIAHEIAHQWWGHQVGWKGYRDQWISEAMANYAALRFARAKLTGEEKPQFGPTSGWQEALTATTEDGRMVESLGPVVLGQRLVSSRSGDAYEPIVYRKGAVILDMLARSMGEENFGKVAQQVVKAAANRPISTEDFLDLVERITGGDFDWFANQYVYGTGLPDIYYTYSIEKAAEGKWAVRGKARQQAPYRFRYRVVKTPAGSFDVARERLDQLAVQTSALVVPFEVEVYDPSRPPAEGKKKGKNGEMPPNAVARGHVLLKGETTDLAIDLPLEPRTFWLDKDAAVFGRFFNASRNPKRVLFYQGLDAAAAGQTADAAALYEQALAAEVAPEDAARSATEKDALRVERKALDGFIELGRARLLLEQGRDAEAREAFTRANKAVGTYGGWVREELRVLESRLDLRQGAADRAYRRLRKGLYKSGAIDGTEGYVLLAIAAQATGNKADLDRAAKAAKENGADLALLGQ
jgi:Peptidase family M1 domain